MPAWQTIRVFISSTFRDMQAERDYLVKVVFPRLEERLIPYRVRLVEIDLRWGVTHEQSENGKAAEICLSQIDACRPFFIGLIGERYGWIPDQTPDELLNPNSPAASQLRRETGKSLTELEILYGALNAPDSYGHAFFFFRKPDFIDEIASADARRIYRDEGESDREKLAKLKAAIGRYEIAAREHYPDIDIVYEYPCRWNGDDEKEEGGRIVGLWDFGNQVEECLWQSIARKLPEILEPMGSADSDNDELAWLESVNDTHDRFSESRLALFVGREAVINEIKDGLSSSGNTRPLLLTGSPGIGKSALIAKMAQLEAVRLEDGSGKELVFQHYAMPGATSDPSVFLRRLCLELRERFAITTSIPAKRKSGKDTDKNTKARRGKRSKTQNDNQPTAVPFPVPDGEGLVAAFTQITQLMPPGAIVHLFLDGIDAMTSIGMGLADWWPESWPTGFRILASVQELDSEAGKFLQERCRLLEVPPLSAQGRLSLVKELPAISAKSLDDAQIALLASNPSTRNPLFLTVALEELRGFGSYEQLSGKIESFPNVDDDRTAIIDLLSQVLTRLTSDFASISDDPDFALLPEWMMTLLACSRVGLSMSELDALICMGDAVKKEMLNVARRQIGDYLFDSGGTISFNNVIMRTSVYGKWLMGGAGKAKEKEIRRKLAEYFASLGPKNDAMRREVLYQYLKLENMEMVEHWLENPDYIMERCRKGEFPELLGEYDQALQLLHKGEHEAARVERLRTYARRLAERAESQQSGAPFYPDSPVDADLLLQAGVNLEPENDDGEKMYTAIECIAAWRQFVVDNRAALSEPDADFGAIAYNYRRSGPVADSVAGFMDDRKDGKGWLRQVWRDEYSPQQPIPLVLDIGREVCLHALSPDAQFIALGYGDGSVEIRSALTGGIVDVLRQHNEKIVGLRFLGEGDRLASADTTGNLRIAGLSDKRTLAAVDGMANGVCKAAFDATGENAVAAASNGDAGLWLAEPFGGLVRRLPECCPFAADLPAISADGRWAATLHDEHLAVWNLVEKSGTLTHRCAIKPKALGWSDDGVLAYAGGEAIRLRRPEESEAFLALACVNPGIITSVSILGGGHVVVVRDKRQIEIWLRTASGYHVRSLRELRADSIGAIEVSADALTAVTLDAAGKRLMVWNFCVGGHRHREEREVAEGHGNSIAYCFRLSGVNAFMTLPETGGMPALWDANNGELVMLDRSIALNGFCVYLTDRRDRIHDTVGGNTFLYNRNADTGKLQKEIKNQQDHFDDPDAWHVFTPDGRATCLYFGALKKNDDNAEKTVVNAKPFILESGRAIRLPDIATTKRSIKGSRLSMTNYCLPHRSGRLALHIIEWYDSEDYENTAYQEWAVVDWETRSLVFRAPFSYDQWITGRDILLQWSRDGSRALATCKGASAVFDLKSRDVLEAPLFDFDLYLTAHYILRTSNLAGEPLPRFAWKKDETKKKYEEATLDYWEEPLPEPIKLASRLYNPSAWRISPNQAYFIVGTHDGWVRVFAMNDGRQLFSRLFVGESVSELDVSPACEIGVAFASGRFRLLKIEDVAAALAPKTIAFRRWLFGADEEASGRWEDNLTAICAWCGAVVSVEESDAGKIIDCRACGKSLDIYSTVDDARSWWE